MTKQPGLDFGTPLEVSLSNSSIPLPPGDKITYAPPVENLCGARQTDPVSSHEADEEHRQSGRAETHCGSILGVFALWSTQNRHSGKMTSHEIAQHLPFDSVEAGRRLSDLKQLNLVEQAGRKVCSVTGRRLTAWRLI